MPPHFMREPDWHLPPPPPPPRPQKNLMQTGEKQMEEIKSSKEYKKLERALIRRLKEKLDPNRKVALDAVCMDLVRRYMDAWVLAENARQDIAIYGHYCTDDRERRYNNPSMKTLSDAEALMERLQRSMDIKTEDLAAVREDEDNEL